MLLGSQSLSEVNVTCNLTRDILHSEMNSLVEHQQLGERQVWKCLPSAISIRLFINSVPLELMTTSTVSHHLLTVLISKTTLSQITPLFYLIFKYHLKWFWQTPNRDKWNFVLAFVNSLDMLQPLSPLSLHLPFETYSSTSSPICSQTCFCYLHSVQ